MKFYPKSETESGHLYNLEQNGRIDESREWNRSGKILNIPEDVNYSADICSIKIFIAKSTYAGWNI